MTDAVRDALEANGSVEVASRADLASYSHWRTAFASQRKDRRYYELIEDTIPEGLEYRYFLVKDEEGTIQAVQPFFVLDQDLLVGVGPKVVFLVRAMRRVLPRFLKLRTLMVGCSAGEGHLDGDERTHQSNARLLASAITAHAYAMKATLIVLKEFPAKYRSTLAPFVHHGFTRIPSLPMTRLNIDYTSFGDYMNRALNGATRRKLRKKFRATEQSDPIALSIVNTVTPIVDEIYPLYLQVYERSKFHFEKLTPTFFIELGRRMSDKVLFFVWRQNGRIVAFAMCMIEGDDFYPEYIGLDYTIALELHLYHYIVRDMISWAIENGYKSLRSSGLNYDPKLHLRHRLDPIDLYVRHRTSIGNAVLKRVLPFIEPTRYTPVLKKFPNYNEL